MWLWGKLTIYALRQHIAREQKPFAMAHGFTREEAIEATQEKLREHFDAAWPVRREDAISTRYDDVRSF